MQKRRAEIMGFRRKCAEASRCGGKRGFESSMATFCAASEHQRKRLLQIKLCLDFHFICPPPQWFRMAADEEAGGLGFAVLNGRETVCVPVWGFFESEALTLGLMGSWRGPGAGEWGKRWMCCVFLLFFSHQRGRAERSLMSADWLRVEQTMSGSSVFADLPQVSCL